MRVLLCGLMGFVIGRVVAFGPGLFWLTMINTDNFEGVAAMQVMFVFTPAGAFLGLLIGLVTELIRR